MRCSSALQQGGATRHSLLINLGGGMITDLGGFAAATFKRGINFINIPTTLLAMVDAAVGGKTGINFGGLKNEIGAFADARFVIINTSFLDTLDAENLCSGYAEMLKHALISDERMWAEHVNFDLSQPDWHELAKMIEASINIKLRYVRRDPLEKDIRKSLNLGHTFGHARRVSALGPLAQEVERLASLLVVDGLVDDGPAKTTQEHGTDLSVVRLLVVVHERDELVVVLATDGMIFLLV